MKRQLPHAVSTKKNNTKQRMLTNIPVRNKKCITEHRYLYKKQTQQTKAQCIQANKLNNQSERQCKSVPFTHLHVPVLEYTAKFNYLFCTKNQCINTAEQHARTSRQMRLPLHSIYTCSTHSLARQKMCTEFMHQRVHAFHYRSYSPNAHARNKNAADALTALSLVNKH